MTKYDVIWYLPQHKAKVLALLNYPTKEERAERGILGLKWWGSQYRPQPWNEFIKRTTRKEATFPPMSPLTKEEIAQYENEMGDKAEKFPALAYHPRVKEYGKQRQAFYKVAFIGPASNWSMVAGNFHGYEDDPDLFRALCDLEELEAGLVVGRFKQGALETERHSQREAESKAVQAARKANTSGSRPSEGPNAKEAIQTATLRFLFLVARAHGVRKPEQLSYAELESFYELGTVTLDWVDETNLERFIAKFTPEQTAEPETKNAMLEDYLDWEEPFRNAFAAMRQTEFKKVA